MPPNKRSQQQKGGYHNKKKKVVEEFNVPTLNLTIPVFTSSLIGKDVEAIFDGLLNEIIMWMNEQVGRGHFGWAKEKVDQLRARVVKEGQTSFSPEDLLVLENERTTLTKQCHDFVTRIAEKLQEEKNAIQLTVRADNQDLEAVRAQLLQLEQKELLVTLLQDMKEAVRTKDLAEIITKKLGMGFSKRFSGKKLNHAFNDYPDVFEQQKSGWLLRPTHRVGLEPA